MQPITITAVDDEKRRIMIDLPDDVPVGEVVITVQPLVAGEYSTDPQTRREQMHAKLIAAGHLSNLRRSPDAKELPPEERERLWKQAAGGKTALELVNEEREERF
jgi:hypothetical protein